MALLDSAMVRRADVLVQCAVLISVAAYFVEIEIIRSTDSVKGPPSLLWLERGIAAILTAEYALRIREAPDRRAYLLSPLGVIDLLSVLPFWLGFFAPDEMLGYIRALRVVRLAKFYRYSRPLRSLLTGLRAESDKLTAVGQVVLMTLALATALIHLAERDAQPDTFGRLSGCLWWAVVTMTTVGYGDAAPVTGVGRAIATGLMFVGIGVVGAFIGIVGGAMFRDQAAPPAERTRKRRRVRVRRRKTGRPHPTDSVDSEGVPQDSVSRL